MLDKLVFSIREEIIEDENKLVLLIDNKLSLFDNDKIERLNKSVFNCEDINFKEQMIIEDEISIIVLLNIECGKIGSEL